MSLEHVNSCLRDFPGSKVLFGGKYFGENMPTTSPGSWEASYMLALTNYLILIISSPLSLIALLLSTGTGKIRTCVSSFKGENFRYSLTSSDYVY